MSARKAPLNQPTNKELRSISVMAIYQQSIVERLVKRSKFVSIQLCMG